MRGEDVADGYADAIESGLNLLNRIPEPSGFDWVEHETLHMLEKQQDDGIIENDRVGFKPRGRLEPQYEMPTSGGAITQW